MNWREIPLADVIFHGSVNYISIKEINIKTKINSYAEAVITLVLMEAENAAGLTDSRIELSIKDKSLFCGVCSDCHLLQQDSYYELILEAKSYSYLADKEKKNQTFQNPGKTFNCIFQNLLSTYNGNINIQKDIAIPRVISQKNETDWEFLVRIANQEKLCVFENVQGRHIMLEVGNGGYKYEELGTDAALLEEGKRISAMRNEMANSYAERGEYEYQYAIYVCNNTTAMAGCICEAGMITASEICSERGVLKNIVTIAGAEECLPELEAQRAEAFSSRILTGKVANVGVSTIQVEFDDEEAVDARTDIPYASVMSNSFYAMPDVEDKVFVYADNQGEIVCLGSKRTDIDDQMFGCANEKSFGALDNLIHFGCEDIDISAARMAYSNKETESEIRINMTPKEGLMITSPKKIRIDSDDKITLAVTPESDSILSAKTKIQISKRMLKTANSVAKAASASEYKPLTTVPNYELSDFFTKEGYARRVDNELDNFKTSMVAGFQDMGFYNCWKKDTPLELHTELGEYENGCLIADTYTIELQVGNVQFRMGIARTNTIEIYAGTISWYGTEQTENYPIKQDELRDAWEIFMDVVVSVIAIAATAVAVAAVIVGTGGLAAIAFGIGLAGAAVAFARDDYFGAITSAIGAFAGGLSQLPKFASFFSTVTKLTSPFKLLYSVGQAAYQLPTAWNLMIDRINAQDTFGGKYAEFICGTLSLYNISTSWAGDFADVCDSYVKPKLKGGNTTPAITEVENNGVHTENGEEGHTTTNPTEGDNHQNGTHDGDPVNVATGALTERHTDLRLKDIRGDFRVVRSYKSTKKNPGRMLGERWLFQFESSLYREEGKCSIYFPDDHLEHFVLTEDGKWRNDVADKKRYLLNFEEEGYLLRDMESHNSYFYGKDGFICYAMDEFGNRTRYTYDRTLLKRVTLESGQYLEFYYEGKKLARLVDGQGRKYEYRYAGELLESVIYPNGGILRYEYTPEGYITKIHNENGKVYLHNHFDRKGRVVRQETADGEEYIFFYNDAQKETTVTKLRLNRSVKYRYNRNDLVECTVFEDGTTIEKKYDANEKVVWEKDRLGNVTQRSFNEHGQLVKLLYPNGLETVFAYNEQGKCAAVTDNQGKNCLYTYNEKGAVSEISIEIEKGRFSTIRYEVDEHGRILSQTYQDGAKKRWVYQKPFLHPTAYCSPEKDEIQYELDEFGRVSVLHNADGEIQYAYNSLHFITMIRDEEDNVTRYTYDLTGLRTGMKKPEDVAADDGLGITYQYDAMDHLLGIEDACGNIYARKVDSEGKLLKLIEPTVYDEETKDGEGVTYKYDANGYRTHRILRDGAVYRFFHDANGNLIKLVLPEDYNALTDDGEGRTFTYDSMNRLLTVRDKQGVLLKKNTYDLAGRLISYSNARMASFGTDGDEEIAAHYKYNQAGWLVEERVPVSKNENQIEYRLRTYEYDMRGNVTCEKRYLDYQDAQSRKGRVLLIHKKYDKNGRLIKVTDSLGACMEYAYNERNKISCEKMKIREGVYQEKKYTYTSSGRLAAVSQSADAKETSGGTSVTRISYDRNGKIVQLTTPMGNEIFYTYDRAGRKTGMEMVQYDGKIKNTVQYAYDRGNRIIKKVTDGRAEHYTYDVCGRRSTVQNILGKTSRYEYDKNGRLTGCIAPRQYDEEGKGVTYLYENDHLTKILLPDGSCKKEFGYNEFGDNIFIKEMGVEAAFTYDLGGRRISIKSSGKASQQQEYDAWGRVIRITDGNENVTGFELDGWGRALKVNRADGGVETFSYDDAGNMMEAVDGLGHTTRFEYNEMNHLARRIDQTGEEELWNYNAEGRIKRYQDRNGNEILFDYNMYGELTRRSASDGMEEVFGYTKDGLLDYCIGGGMRYDYCYDDFGRLTEKKASGRTLISYEYDDYSQMVARTDLTGKRTEYQYDDRGRLLQVLDDGIEQASYSYDEQNRLSEQVSGALRMAYDYDLDGNISRIHATLSEDNLFDNHYQYDANGNCTRIERQDSVTEYAYDCMNRLSQAAYPDHMEKFAYDYADNRISREYYSHFDMQSETADIGIAVEMREVQAIGKVPNETEFFEEKLFGSPDFREEYLYDERNRLTEKHILSGDSFVNSSITPENSLSTSLQADMMQSIHYTYDANGNLIQDENAEYGYDGFNRLSEIRTADGGYQRNTYDAEGLRAQLLENNELVRFLYHNGEVIAETNDKQETTRYIRGLGLISSDSEKAKTYYHYVSDERGSITDIVKASVKKKLSEDAKKTSGRSESSSENPVAIALRKLQEKPVVLNHYEYDAFGNTLVCEEKIENRFRFAGEIYDAVTGQYYLRARFYNPVLGRFTQEDDRYDDGLNLYAYCRNNPVKYIDPSGHGTTSAPDRDSQADFYDNLFDSQYDTNPAYEQFLQDMQDAHSEGTNQSSLFDLVDEMNQIGGCDSTDQSTIYDWANEYGLDYDSLGVNAKNEGVQ